jgi:methylmalonyl-CoA mutase, C-terminal domain
MELKMVRILMAKLGEGYEQAMMKLALALREAGFEVIYTDTQKPEAIVKSAIQEAVDHIGITTLPGANIEDMLRIVQLLEKEGAPDIKVTAGGFLSYEDIPQIREMGIEKYFPKGTTIKELIDWARENIRPAEA